MDGIQARGVRVGSGQFVQFLERLSDGGRIGNAFPISDQVLTDFFPGSNFYLL